jgi:hypothetical protein
MIPQGTYGPLTWRAGACRRKSQGLPLRAAGPAVARGWDRRPVIAMVRPSSLSFDGQDHGPGRLCGIESPAVRARDRTAHPNDRHAGRRASRSRARAGAPGGVEPPVRATQPGGAGRRSEPPNRAGPGAGPSRDQPRPGRASRSRDPEHGLRELRLMSGHPPRANISTFGSRSVASLRSSEYRSALTVQTARIRSTSRWSFSPSRSGPLRSVPVAANRHV